MSVLEVGIGMQRQIGNEDVCFNVFIKIIYFPWKGELCSLYSCNLSQRMALHERWMCVSL